MRRDAEPFSEPRWKLWCLIGIVAVTFAGVWLLDPVRQDPGYHGFADARAVLGIPNFLNVASNIAFLLVGGLGVARCIVKADAPHRLLWGVTFGGIALVALGSGYYHWSPHDATLAWDRLPMTVAFMALLSALLSEYVAERVGHAVLVPALAVGLFSVYWWQVSGDLRLYLWVQFAPLLVVGAVLVLYRSRYTHQWLLTAALAFYVLAKVFEHYDAAIYSALGQSLSGHTLKHLCAAVACYCLVALFSLRRPVA